MLLRRGLFRLSIRDVLVAAEVALCFILCSDFVLSVRGLENVLQMPSGFKPSAVSTVAFDLGLAGYSEARGSAFQQQALTAVKQLPCALSAGYANSLPLSIDQSTTGVQGENQQLKKGRGTDQANYYQVSPGFLSTLGVPLLRGRDFDLHDTADSSPVAIVNRTFAARIMHTNNPVGQAFRSGFNGPHIKVVGLVADGKYVSLSEPPRAAVFWPIRQRYNATTTLTVRSGRAPDAMAGQIRETVNRLDPHLPVYRNGQLTRMLGFAVFPMRAATVTLTAFGVLALVLAMTGINGLLAYGVSRRVKEIGIRIALGAKRAALLRFLLGPMVVLVACELAGGFAWTGLSFAGFRRFTKRARIASRGSRPHSYLPLSPPACRHCCARSEPIPSPPFARTDRIFRSNALATEAVVLEFLFAAI